MSRSHIQVPGFILKKFEDSKIGKVHYYDIRSDHFGATSCKLLGTEHDYYNKNTEEVLNSTFEKPMAVLTNNIITFFERKEESLVVTDVQTKIVKQYLISLMGRSGIFEKSVDANSVFSQFLHPQVVRAYSILSVINNMDIDSIPFQTYQLGLIHIINTRSFIIPRNGFYQAQREDSMIIIIPISPKVAVVLAPLGSYFDLIDDEQSVDILNLRALVYEKLYNNSFVAANNKKELLHIVNIAKKRKIL